MTKRKYYVNKRCTKLGGSKINKEPNDKKKVIYNISKFKNWVVPKNKRAEKT